MSKNIVSIDQLVTVFTKETAEVVYSILDQEPSRCRDIVMSLLKTLSDADVRADGGK